MPILLNDEEMSLARLSVGDDYGDDGIMCVATAKAQLKKAFEQLDEIIYYRPDAPYKTTIDWDKYQEFRQGVGL